MKIAIIGTNGFLSTTIAKYAIDKGWALDMFGLDKPTQHSYRHFYSIDLTSGYIEVDKLCEADIIVYAVGAGIQSNLKESADLIYALNVNVPVRICNMLKQVDYKGVFVTFGSYFELGETTLNRPATEDDIINANAPAPTDYVVSKRMLTRFVTSYKHDFTHWHFILPTIYGPGENPMRLIPYTISAIRNGENLHFTSGEQVRQYLCASEVPVVLDKAYMHSLSSGIYNIAGSGTLTVKQIVVQICEAYGKQMSPDWFGGVQRMDTNMRYLALTKDVLLEKIGFSATLKMMDQINCY